MPTRTSREGKQTQAHKINYWANLLPSFYYSTHSVRKKKHESNPINPPSLLRKAFRKKKASFYSFLQLPPFSPATSDHWLPGYTHVE